MLIKKSFFVFKIERLIYICQKFKKMNNNNNNGVVIISAVPAQPEVRIPIYSYWRRVDKGEWAKVISQSHSINIELSGGRCAIIDRNYQYLNCDAVDSIKSYPNEWVRCSESEFISAYKEALDHLLELGEDEEEVYNSKEEEEYEHISSSDDIDAANEREDAAREYRELQNYELRELGREL